MKYEITGVVTEDKYSKNDVIYWFVKDKKEEVVAIARLSEDKNYCDLDIDYKGKTPPKEAIEELLDEVLIYTNSRVKRIDIQILDVMKEIKEVLEKKEFHEVFRSEYEDNISAVRYCKVFI